MEALVSVILKYGAVAFFILITIAAIAHFRLEFYETGKKKKLKQKIKEKLLVPVRDKSLEEIAEQLKGALEFSTKKVEVDDTEICVNVFMDGVRSKISVRIKPKDGYYVVEPLASYALDWNVAGQVEETLAYVCGEKNKVDNEDAKFEFAKLLRLKNSTRMYQWIAIGVIAVWMALHLPYFQTPDYVDVVKQTVLTDTDAPIGDVFDDFFGEQEWSNAKANVDGYAYVVMEGVCYYEVLMDNSRELVDVGIDFLINEDTGVMVIQNISANGELLDTTAQAAFLEDVYETHMAQTSYQSFEALLGDFAGYIGNEMMEGMLGHYVSYFSEESQETNAAENTTGIETEIETKIETEVETEMETVTESPMPQAEEETEGVWEGNTEEISANPYSDSVLLWKSYYEPLVNEDFAGLSKEELRIARNEIYAAYGRIFSAQDLKDYFNSKPWYAGTVPAEQFDDSVLNDVQKANLEMILLYEDLAGQEDFY